MEEIEEVGMWGREIRWTATPELTTWMATASSRRRNDTQTEEGGEKRQRRTKQTELCSYVWRRGEEMRWLI